MAVIAEGLALRAPLGVRAGYGQGGHYWLRAQNRCTCMHVCLQSLRHAYTHTPTYQPPCPKPSNGPEEPVAGLLRGLGSTGTRLITEKLGTRLLVADEWLEKD